MNVIDLAGACNGVTYISVSLSGSNSPVWVLAALSSRPHSVVLSAWWTMSAKSVGRFASQMAVPRTCGTTRDKSGQVCRPGSRPEHQIPERKASDFRLGHGTSRPEKGLASVAAEILLRWHHVF